LNILLLPFVVSGVRAEATTRERRPCLGARVAVLALLSRAAGRTLWLPHAMGYAR
jgi:hypothetical protein